MNNEEKKELIIIVIDLNNLLMQYIELHNTLIKNNNFSLHSIFKTINFGMLHKDTDNVLKQIDISIDKITEIEQSLINDECEFLIILREYSSSLRTAVHILVKILDKLFEKSQGNFQYSYKKYNYYLDNYILAIDNYEQVGNLFNIKFKEFNENVI